MNWRCAIFGHAFQRLSPQYLRCRRCGADKYWVLRREG